MLLENSWKSILMVMAFVVGIILFHVFIAHGLHVGVYETDNEDSDIFQPATHLKVISSFDSPNCSEPVCTGPLSNIYCSGKILHASWLFGLQRSCPGDMMRNSPAFILKEFSKLKYPLKRDEFKAFCFENFASVPYLKYAELDDWSESPPNVVLLKDTKFWKFVNELNQIWKNLGREFIPKVHELPHLFPIVPVLNRFVVPGGFFQIYFYWDSYWIMKGLLFSNMKSTVLGMLENFASIIDRHGFIPNSGAIQLSRRSQPPLFTQMVADYISVVENKTTLSRMVTYVERELMWWQLNRNVSVKSASGETYLMYQYRAVSNCPRPENYLKDLNDGVNGTEDAEFIWSSIASACESGLDFSSRWFAYVGPGAESKRSIRTNDIIPVDLNVIMVWNYRTLAYFYAKLNDFRKSVQYLKAAANLRHAIDDVLWNSTHGVWFDYDIKSDCHRNRFYPSNLYPLILNDSNEEQATRILKYLTGSGALTYKGGVPSSLDKDAKEQWDFPNGWAPSIHLFVESLRLSGSTELVTIAKEVADKFIRTVMNGLLNPVGGMPGTCWEKYDVRYDDGRPGTGGEYPVQQGFGWTNGAVLDLIYRFYIANSSALLKDREVQISISSSSVINQHLKDFFNQNINNYFVLISLILCCSVIIWFLLRTFAYTSHHYRSWRNLNSGVTSEPAETEHLFTESDTE